jgi:hypothetical protein
MPNIVKELADQTTASSLFLCDIGRTPFGDGVVDVEDLIVLAEHLFEEFPPAVPETPNGEEVE